jgi:hypothetical protein
MPLKLLSGIRINFSKTEMIPMNITMEDANILAVLVSCKISSFPLKYLGVPLFDGKIKIQDWHTIIDKVQQKIPNWQGTLLSVGVLATCGLVGLLVYY